MKKIVNVPESYCETITVPLTAQKMDFLSWRGLRVYPDVTIDFGYTIMHTPKKIEELKIENYIFFGVIPWNEISKGVYECKVDCWKRHV